MTSGEKALLGDNISMFYGWTSLWFFVGSYRWPSSQCEHCALMPRQDHRSRFHRVSIYYLFMNFLHQIIFNHQGHPRTICNADSRRVDVGTGDSPMKSGKGGLATAGYCEMVTTYHLDWFLRENIRIYHLLDILEIEDRFPPNSHI